MFKSVSVPSIIDVESDGFIWVSVNPIKAFFKHLQSCTILFTWFADDRSFKINFLKVSSKTAFLSVVERKQWSFSHFYSFSAYSFTLIGELLCLSVQNNLTNVWVQYIFFTAQISFTSLNQNQQYLGQSLSLVPCEQ